MERKQRRTVLCWLAAAPFLGMAGARAEDGKAKKADMRYQDEPKDGQRCADCLQFIPGKDPKGPGSCQIVESPISPNGWCIEFQKKK